MTPEELIEENLEGVWEEVGDEDISAFYKDVIKLMLQKYAIEWLLQNIDDASEYVYNSIPVRGVLLPNDIEAGLGNWLLMKKSEFENT